MSTATAARVQATVNLGDDPLSTIVGVLRDLSDELQRLMDRVSILEAQISLGV